MISPRCDRCNEELADPGALLFSPPYGVKVNKFHFCILCYHQVCEWIVLTGWRNLPCQCPEDHCCKLHDRHSDPHKGCILR